MKRYIYIVALTDPTNTDLKFRHAFVEAEDDAGAYDAGFKAVKIEPTEGRHNDYVVELEESDEHNYRRKT